MVIIWVLVKGMLLDLNEDISVFDITIRKSEYSMPFFIRILKTFC